MGSFFSFDRMITPTIIKIVFWIGLALTVLLGLGLLIAGNNGGVRVLGLVYLIFGPILWRVYCEILIVVFKMQEHLAAIEQNTGGSTFPAGAAYRDDPAPATP